MGRRDPASGHDPLVAARHFARLPLALRHGARCGDARDSPPLSFCSCSPRPLRRVRVDAAELGEPAAARRGAQGDHLARAQAEPGARRRRRRRRLRRGAGAGRARARRLCRSTPSGSGLEAAGRWSPARRCRPRPTTTCSAGLQLTQPLPTGGKIGLRFVDRVDALAVPDAAPGRHRLRSVVVDGVAAGAAARDLRTRSCAASACTRRARRSTRRRRCATRRR